MFICLCRRFKSSKFHSLPFTLRATSTSAIRKNNHVQESPDESTPKFRYNEVGVQMLPASLRSQIFSGTSVTPPSKAAVSLSNLHLRYSGLYHDDRRTEFPDPKLELPKLLGKSIEEHFWNLGLIQSHPYRKLAKDFSKSTLPDQPETWSTLPGWTRYNLDGTFELVPFPPESVLTFDVETMYKHSDFPVLACAASPTNWYSWMSPWLAEEETEEETKEESEEESDEPTHLIPLPSLEGGRLIVGHNVGFDRARIKDEYSLEDTGNRFLDTMALHVAIHGLTSTQRSIWLKHKKMKEQEKNDKFEETEGENLDPKDGENNTGGENEDRRPTEEKDPPTQASSKTDPSSSNPVTWLDVTSTNSLAEVSRLHLGIEVDKSIREDLADLSRDEVFSDFQTFAAYCANDVLVTHQIFSKLLPTFFDLCPHPATFSSMLQMGNSFLPVDKNWPKYLKDCEDKYQELLTGVTEKLIGLAEEARDLIDQRDSDGNFVWEKDPWLKQLDWSPKKAKRLRIDYDSKDSSDPLPPQITRDLYWPKWYWELDRNPQSDGKTLNLTVRSKVAPLLLKLCWDGFPVVRSKQHGWLYKVPLNQRRKIPSRYYPVIFKDPSDIELTLDKESLFFKIPHTNGEDLNVGTPLSKPFIQAYENGRLTSEYKEAKTALDMNAQCSYWISSRERIMEQLVVWDNVLNAPGTLNQPQSDLERGMILPPVITIGAITRRSVEKTWLTASNAKKNRVGSELKAMVRAPPGYAIVGADVDSEELWISSVMGDAQFGFHGATAIGWMTLEGTKSAGTDLHSKTASILGISRDAAKVFNYSRIYGAGVKHAIQLLLKDNPTLDEAQAQKLAQDLYTSTKGTKSRKSIASGHPFNRDFWHGGTESFLFNTLENIASGPDPRTPALGCGITLALRKDNLPKTENSEAGTDFMTSRVNWVVQSSGVDYLHLLILSMEYLMKTFQINGRYMISVHDEIRYLVKEEDKYRAALALQIANLWTRGLFAHSLEMDDLPQSCAFFSAVDIDFVLRKEVNMPCITPSHPEPIPPGESLDIYQILEKVTTLIAPLFHTQPDRVVSHTSSASNKTSSSSNSSVYDSDLIALEALKSLSLDPSEAWKPSDRRYREVDIEFLRAQVALKKPAVLGYWNESLYNPNRVSKKGAAGSKQEALGSLSNPNRASKKDANKARRSKEPSFYEVF